MRKDVIVVGLFDKDTKHQEITTLAARNLVANLFAHTVGGATITDGQGVYTHQNGKDVVIEPSLVCTVYDADDKSIKSTIELIKGSLNQESVAWETSESNTRFI